MKSITRQPELPLSGAFPEPAPPADATQRWAHGWHSWIPRSAGGFDPGRYEVREIPELQARDYVTQNHYARQWVPALFRYGLFYLDETTGPDLVGVAVYGVPMHPNVITNAVDVDPLAGVELSRFVLEGEPLAPHVPGGRAPGNAESWFLARTLNRLADRSVSAVIAFSDPVPRIIAGRTLWPGHVGTIYQASNAIYLGRASKQTLVVLPDGTTLAKRTISKIRRQESGHAGAERRLVALGADPHIGPDPATWLARALASIGAQHVQHNGNHKYVLFTSGDARAHTTVWGIALPYPKKHFDLGTTS
jgi:hypothetical protein